MAKGCVLLGVLSKMGKVEIFLGLMWGDGVGFGFQWGAFGLLEFWEGEGENVGIREDFLG